MSRLKSGGLLIPPNINLVPVNALTNLGGTVTDLQMYKGILYAITYQIASVPNNTIISIDVSDPSNPVILDTLAVGSVTSGNTFSSRHVFFYDDYAVISGIGITRIVDVSDPSDLTFVGTASLGPSSSSGKISSNEDLFYQHNDTLFIVRRFTPPSTFANTDTGTLVLGFSSQPTYDPDTIHAYIARVSYSAPTTFVEIERWNLSNPADISRVATVTNGLGSIGNGAAGNDPLLTFHKDHVIGACWIADGILIFSADTSCLIKDHLLISTGGELTLLASIHAQGNKLYVPITGSVGNRHIAVIDIDNPANISVEQVYNNDTILNNVYCCYKIGDYLYVGTGADLGSVRVLSLL